MAEDLKNVNPSMKKRAEALRRVADIKSLLSLNDSKLKVFFGEDFHRKYEILASRAINEVVYSNNASFIPSGNLENYIIEEASREIEKRLNLEMEQRALKIKNKELKKAQKESLKRNKTSRQAFSDTNKNLYDNLVSLRRDHMIQQAWLDMKGVGSLSEREKDVIREHMKDSAVAELLVGAQMSANLDIYNEETMLTNDRFAKIDKLTRAYDEKSKGLESEGMLVTLFKRNFDLVEGTQVQVKEDGTLEFFDSQGTPVESEDVVLGSNGDNHDKLVGTVKEFEAFVKSTDAMHLKPKAIAKEYNRAIDDALKTSPAYEPTVMAQRRARVELLKDSIVNLADNDELAKQTFTYAKYNQDINKVKMLNTARSAVLYENILSEYQELLQDGDVQGFIAKVQGANNSEIADRVREIKASIGLEVGNSMVIGDETLDAVRETIESTREKLNEIEKENTLDFLRTEAFNLNGMGSPCRTVDGSFVIFDPSNRNADESGYYSVASFSALKNRYVSLDENLDISALTEEQFFQAAENGQIEYGKLSSMRERYDSFIDEKAKVEYLRERSYKQVKSAIENETPITFVNERGNVVRISYERSTEVVNEGDSATIDAGEYSRGEWVYEEAGEEKRSLLDFSGQKTAEQLENEDVLAFVQDKIMPSVYRSINYDEPELTKAELAELNKKKHEIDQKYRSQVCDELSKLHDEAVNESAHSTPTAGGSTSTPTAPKGPAPSGPTPPTGGPTPAGATPTDAGPSGPSAGGSAPAGASPTAGGASPAGPSGPTGGTPSAGGTGAPSASGGVAVDWYNNVFKAPEPNYSAMLKMWTVKLCMTHDQKISACSALAERYRLYSATVPTTPYNGKVTIVYHSAGPAPTAGGAGPTGPTGGSPSAGGPAPAGPTPTAGGPTPASAGSSGPTAGGPIPTPGSAGPSGPEGEEGDSATDPKEAEHEEPLAEETPEEEKPKEDKAPEEMEGEKPAEEKGADEKKPEEKTAEGEEKSVEAEEEKKQEPELTEKGQKAKDRLEKLEANLGEIDAKLERRSNERDIQRLNGARKAVMNEMEALEKTIEEETIQPKEIEQVQEEPKREEKTEPVQEEPEKEEEINFGEPKPKTEAEVQQELDDFLKDVDKPRENEETMEKPQEEPEVRFEPEQTNEGKSPLDRVNGASSGGRELTQEELQRLQKISEDPEFGMDA